MIFSPVQFSNHTLPATLFRNNHSVFLATLTFSALKDLQEILFFSGLPLNRWKTVLHTVVDAINFNKKSFRSHQQMLHAFFTQPVTYLPQSTDRFYKYKVNDKVRIECPPAMRKQLGFKYTLNRGTLVPSGRESKVRVLGGLLKTFLRVYISTA